MYTVNCHEFPLFKVSISMMDCKLPSSDGVDSCTKSGRPSYKNKPASIVIFISCPYVEKTFCAVVLAYHLYTYCYIMVNTMEHY